MSICFSCRNPLFTRASRSSVFILDFFHSLAGLGRGGDVVVMTLEQISLPHCGISSSRHQPLSPWTETASSSKSKGSSLASARGLRWWRVVAARVDFQYKVRQQKQQWTKTWIDLF
jgi:hypothetical protein